MDDLPDIVRESIKACCEELKKQNYSNDQAMLIILTLVEEIQQDIDY